MTFSKIASLNGVHMFLKSHDITLLSTDLPDVTVVWKEFERCIILIAIASGVTKYVLDKFLDATFGAMVLFTGIDEIKNTKNIERLKKDMRLCSPIIDRLMDCLNIGDKISTKTDMINMTECIISPESHLLQVLKFSCIDDHRITYNAQTCIADLFRRIYGMLGVNVRMYSGARLCGSCYRRLVVTGSCGKKITNNSDCFGEYLYYTRHSSIFTT